MSAIDVRRDTWGEQFGRMPTVGKWNRTGGAPIFRCPQCWRAIDLSGFVADDGKVDSFVCVPCDKEFDNVILEMYGNAPA